MNQIWISVILIMSLMGFASALDGSSEDYGIDSIYSQYYSINKAPATINHIEAPQQYAISVTPPTIYVGSQMQAMPYPQYYATYTGGNSLWIQGSTSWTQYAKVPQGAILSLLALSPTGSEGSLYEKYPNGKVIISDFYFYPTSRIGFYADAPGRHALYFVMGGQPSNEVVIDVVPYKAPLYTSYYPYYWYYYPYYWYNYPYYWHYYSYYWHYYPYYGDDHHDDGDHHQDGTPYHEPYPGEKPYYPEEKPYPDPYTGEITSYNPRTGENLPYPMDNNDYIKTPYHPEEKSYPDPYTGEIASYDSSVGDDLPYPVDIGGDLPYPADMTDYMQKNSNYLEEKLYPTHDT